MSYKNYKHCPYSDEFMDKIYKENYNFKLPPIITKYHNKIPEDFYTEEWTGIIFKAGVLSRQGNHYDAESIRNHLTDCRIRDLLMAEKLFGEFYPNNICNDEISIAVIKPSNASVLFTKIWMDDNNSIHANFKCVNNEYGKIVYDKLNTGLPVYFNIACICKIYDSSNISLAPTNIINDYNMYCKKPDESSAFMDFGNIRIVDVEKIITFDVITSYLYPYDIIDNTYPDGKYERISKDH